MTDIDATVDKQKRVKSRLSNRLVNNDNGNNKLNKTAKDNTMGMYKEAWSTISGQVMHKCALSDRFFRSC